MIVKMPVINSVDELKFGLAPKPVKCGYDVVIGGGEVIPEINFTLPPMSIDEKNWPEVRSQYEKMITEVCQRSVELETPALVAEFELLPPMTLNPSWGAEITGILKDTLANFNQKYGLRSALRVTPVDVRESQHPPKMRRGEFYDKTMQSFELCAQAGADMLAIESIGGKEVHDDALLNADLPGIIFALGVLGVRDMQFLWKEIVKIAETHNIIASGDTACGFGNTAMVLADKRMIPKTLAAVIRVVSVVRTLQAHLVGAVGPSKDCAYEGPYLKALTGIPISMEGKSSACAHLSTLGNIAGACCDLWSNESVQNVRLLSTYAPVVSLENLVYDCRLMNVSLSEGKDSASKLQGWFVESDAHRDPQAWVLKPDVVIKICSELAQCTSPLEMALHAAKMTLEILWESNQNGELQIPKQEIRWFDRMNEQLSTIPRDDEALWAMVRDQYKAKLIASEYLLSE